MKPWSGVQLPWFVGPLKSHDEVPLDELTPLWSHFDVRTSDKLHCFQLHWDVAERLPCDRNWNDQSETRGRAFRPENLRRWAGRESPRVAFQPTMRRLSKARQHWGKIGQPWSAAAIMKGLVASCNITHLGRCEHRNCCSLYLSPFFFCLYDEKLRRLCR